uniref:Uncharacterized protein n=1 Tax=Heterorhabditis bacteriophora TaxID=37862 RepID=A0A1I7WMC9_HETBA
MIRPVVYSNCIHSMLSILRAMFHLQIEYADNDRVWFMDIISSMYVRLTATWNYSYNITKILKDFKLYK